MNTQAPIALTTGEPAGVGPDIVLNYIREPTLLRPIVVLGNRQLLSFRAQQLQINDLQIRRPELNRLLPLPDYNPAQPQPLSLLSLPLAAPVVAGQLNSANSGYVIAQLERAAAGCLSGEFAALVTAPVHKGIVNEAGIAFTGHTEWLAKRSQTHEVVMMLSGPRENGAMLRVALATTHLPLAQVAAAITAERLNAALRILHTSLIRYFGIADPHILIAGLNPHAGEQGHLGHEEQHIIQPVIQKLLSAGLQLTGPLPADTLFQPEQLDRADAVLAMYHDQGLPVLKYASFNRGTNVTLGLPFIRTSVDHGTALTLAGTGRASRASLSAALQLAATLRLQ